MAQVGHELDPNELDNFVRAYEEAYARDHQAAIDDFLPPADHPLYADVLRELVRVDLEYRWERGCPKSLADYQRAFPQLAHDRAGLREIAFEEFRLRRQAGQDPSPEEYRRCHGDTLANVLEQWRATAGPHTAAPEPRADGSEQANPQQTSGDKLQRAPLDELQRAAIAYSDFRRDHDPSDAAAIDSWCQSFPGQADHAHVFRDIHRSDPQAAARLARSVIAMPRVGDVFLGFRLIAELGRGAFGRVYLARQGDLADRPVALKVSTEFFGESQTLARLQHTNIVPIYSVHHVEPFQAVCMPYFGSTTLNDVFQDLKTHERLPESGVGLLSTLNSRRESAGHQDDSRAALRRALVEPAGAPDASTAAGLAAQPAASSTDTLRMIEGLTYVQAVLWVASRLADGLIHAHERGILHRDLKPANILLTDDGQPMLLDFNLSDDLKLRVGPAASIGGTLPYMSPEQLAAIRFTGRPLDARSDLYSLGVIIFELLTGKHPFPVPTGLPEVVLDRMIVDRRGPVPDVLRWNKSVTPAVASIARHCLEPNPKNRYQSARELREDLDRHLAHLPLKYAPEPSVRERFVKWTRRHPIVCSSTSIGLASLVVLMMLGAVTWLTVDKLRTASAWLQREKFRAAFDECQLLLNTNGGPPEHIDRGLRRARQALNGYKVGGPGDWTTGPLVRRLPAAQQWALREEISELVMLEARARVALADRSGTEADRRRALVQGLAWLDRAERFDPRPPAVLFEDRARYHAALGQSESAVYDSALAANVPPASARDFYLLGSSHLARGRPDLAEVFLNRAIALDARRFWAWFVLGLCHSDQSRHAEAAYDFSVCTILSPSFAWPYLNRGLALARAGRLTEARSAYDRALEVNPDFAEARLDRALTCLELGDVTQALQDLDRALELGQRTPAVAAARAESLSRLGRHAEAEQAFSEAIHSSPNDPVLLVARGYSRLHRDPTSAAADFAGALAIDSRNARAHLGRAYLLRRDDPRAALAQIELALDCDPALDDALQLRALIRGRLGDPAAEADVARLLSAPTPRRLYNAACTLSLMSRSSADPQLVPRALDLLRRAIDSGLPLAGIAEDPDLEGLRKTSEFSRLVSRK